MTEHTKKPWNFHRTMGGVGLIESGGSHTVTGLQVAVIEHGRKSEDADILLISAAPEMLEALIWAKEALRDRSAMITVRKRIDAAIAKAQGRDTMTETESTQGPWAELREVRQANARLIAAAPDLLEALESMLSEHCGNHECDDVAHDLARTTIAKIKGE